MVIDFINTITTKLKYISSDLLRRLQQSSRLVPLSVKDQYEKWQPMEQHHLRILRRCNHSDRVHELIDYKQQILEYEFSDSLNGFMLTICKSSQVVPSHCLN